MLIFLFVFSLAFFIAVQLFFTLCFMLMLVGIAGTMMYVLCFTYEHQVKLLRALGWDLTIAGVYRNLFLSLKKVHCH